MLTPKVTIVVSPRERFSYAQTSLESIYKHTRIPFHLVYIDGNSPKYIQQYLENESQQKGFDLIRINHYLTPNQARNIGLSKVRTPFVVFIDNDVVVTPNWLDALVRCAEETGAAIVGPLTCQDEPVHETIHFANGVAHVIVDAKGRRRLREKMTRQGRKVADDIGKLKREPAELVEFHCMLVSTEIFQQLGPLDEQYLNTKEHVDLCMSAAAAGEKIYFEPASLITYVPGISWHWSDLLFYMLRWSDAWEKASLEHLKEKWNLSEDIYFTHKYKALGWRRRKTILSPILHRLTFGLLRDRTFEKISFGLVKTRLIEKIFMYGLLAPADRLLNQYLTRQHARKWWQQSTPKTPLPLTPQPNSRSPKSKIDENTFAT